MTDSNPPDSLEPGDLLYMSMLTPTPTQAEIIEAIASAVVDHVIGQQSRRNQSRDLGIRERDA